jgi:hypothetical protein
VIATIPLLGSLGTLSLVVLFYILAKLSERFGSVIRMRPIYRYYYVGLILMLIGYATHLGAAQAISTPEVVPAWLRAGWFLLIGHHLPLATGMTIGLMITWRYWSWLVTEQDS